MAPVDTGFIKLMDVALACQLKRQVVSKHDSRDLIAEVERSSGTRLEVARSAQVEILEPDDDSRFVIIDGRFTFVNGGEGGGYLPYVGSAEAVAVQPVAAQWDDAEGLLKTLNVDRVELTSVDEHPGVAAGGVSAQGSAER